MTLLVRALGALLAVALTAGLVLGSGLPYTVDSREEALIRLSWRAVGERVEACRKLSEEELAALPVHMRQSEVCEARLSPFRLAVSIDGAPVFDGRIHPSGARQDRPTYVLQEFPVAPGTHRLEVVFESEPEQQSDATPRPRLAFDQRVNLAARDIFLLTHDSETGQLVGLYPRPTGRPIRVDGTDG